MFENKVVKLAIAYLIIMFIGFIYDKYKKTIDIEEQYSDGELIQKYLLNDSSLTKNNKPILWVHIEFDKNARSWESFGSRTSDNLNQPYQYLTIRNIILLLLQLSIPCKLIVISEFTCLSGCRVL